MFDLLTCQYFRPYVRGWQLFTKATNVNTHKPRFGFQLLVSIALTVGSSEPSRPTLLFVKLANIMKFYQEVPEGIYVAEWTYRHLINFFFFGGYYGRRLPTEGGKRVFRQNSICKIAKVDFAKSHL